MMISGDEMVETLGVEPKSRKVNQ